MPDMNRISREYVDYLESIVYSLLADRKSNTPFLKHNLDRGPDDEPEIYHPEQVREVMTETYRQFVDNGWK